jgi:hypothetical protein
MIRTSARWGLAMSIALTLSAVALAETREELTKRIFQQTKIAALTSLPVPASEYKGDGNPETLEIVFLEKKVDGPSRVSEDGEVIFLYKASDKKQQELIGKAFEIRIARALNGT